MPITAPRHIFTPSNIALAPETAGVYGLYARNETIYYGRSSQSIRSRLADHLSGREGACTQNAVEFNWEVPLYPTTREKELLEEHKRVYGQYPRCNERAG